MAHEQTRALDLFCGIGGFSHGVVNEGGDVVAGVDYDEDALSTYQHNFEHPAYCYDLAETSPQQFFEGTDIDPESIDLIVGGPPCQSFSLAGSRRDDDDRDNRIDDFVDYVEYVRPAKVIMENVQGIESKHGGVVVEHILARFEELGYVVAMGRLDASKHGDPQKRVRWILRAVRSDVDIDPTLPASTHGYDQ